MFHPLRQYSGIWRDKRCRRPIGVAICSLRSLITRQSGRQDPDTESRPSETPAFIGVVYRSRQRDLLDNVGCARRRFELCRDHDPPRGYTDARQELAVLAWFARTNITTGKPRRHAALGHPLPFRETFPTAGDLTAARDQIVISTGDRGLPSGSNCGRWIPPLRLGTIPCRGRSMQRRCNRGSLD